MNVSSDAAPSTIAASTTWPRPERFASSKAASTPTTRYNDPPPKSPSRLSGGTGPRPPSPFDDVARLETRRAGTHDADDVGTHVREQHGGKRRRSYTGEFDDPKAGEWPVVLVHGFSLSEGSRESSSPRRAPFPADRDAGSARIREARAGRAVARRAQCG